MKIAIASNENMCCEHFGHCEGFKVYEIENEKVVSEMFFENPGHKPGFLPVFLKEKGANVVIAGGMGEMAQQIFKENNIEVIVGVSGNLEQIVKEYIAKNLKSTGAVCDKHENEGNC
ncbi:MAG TPA: NifB/NifX family molybdenum-iron cluster-binding protein [Clostridia bacterium]|nr:NifB/NifX family molybdenum-iron cluster-binding protein [Clostridia bacterium]